VTLVPRLMTEDAYRAAAAALIGRLEGHVSRARDIGDGRATIGHGYTFERGDNLALWSAAAIALTEAERAVLARIDAAATQAGRTAIALGEFGRTLTTAEARALLAVTLPAYEGPADALGLPPSAERAALVSITYNRGAGAVASRMTEFLAAVEAGDRQAAWFEIRYNAQTALEPFQNGIAKRRYIEAETFGAFDDSLAPRPDEALRLGRLYAAQRDVILGYEARWNPASYPGEALDPIAALLAAAAAAVQAGLPALAGFRPGEFLVAGETGTRIAGDGTAWDSDTRAADLILGGAGNDTLTGGRGTDGLAGGGGRDRLTGGAGDDTLTGGPGNDRLAGDAGTDAHDDGTATLSHPGASALARALAAAQAGTGAFAGSGAAPPGADRIDGGGGHDRAFGGGGADRIAGGAGNDTLAGGDGNDTLAGGGGRDVLHGGRGADRLAGGPGDDVYLLDRRGDRAVERAGEGDDAAVLLAPGRYLLREIETVVLADGLAEARLRLAGGGEGRLVLGNAADNRIVLAATGAAAVTLDGGGGADTFVLAPRAAGALGLTLADAGTADAIDLSGWGIAARLDAAGLPAGAGAGRYLAPAGAALPPGLPPDAAAAGLVVFDWDGAAAVLRLTIDGADAALILV
jgi:GH24 family phage-related lysozyme (muramidase)